MKVGPERERRREGVLSIAALLACAAVVAAGCGGRRLAAGAVPFPSSKPVFADADGRPLRDLPDAPEGARLVVLDFPWCPPCAETWKAVLAASASLPPGSVRVYRIVFDRERFFTREGVSVVPPLLPPAPREPAGDAAREPAVTTLTAYPDEFRREYEIAQAPVVLLMSRGGKVLRRWTGHSASLPASLAGELGRFRDRGQESSVSPPP